MDDGGTGINKGTLMLVARNNLGISHHKKTIDEFADHDFNVA